MKNDGNSRRKPKQRRSQDTVETVLEAAAQILSAGKLNFTTNHIAERAGISIGTLYQYFPDKDAIYTELFLREIHEDATRLEATIREIHRHPFEAVVPKLIEVFLERLLENPKLRSILRYKASETARHGDLKDIKLRVADLLTSLLRTHPDFRIRRDIRLEILIVVNSVEAALYAAIEEFGESLPSRRLVREVSDLVLKYLAKHRSKEYRRESRLQSPA